MFAFWYLFISGLVVWVLVNSFQLGDCRWNEREKKAFFSRNLLMTPIYPIPSAWYAVKYGVIGLGILLKNAGLSFKPWNRNDG